MRPARRQVEERISALEARTREMGKAARAPGAAAIGRALLALGRNEAAVARLTEAWESGDRDEETAFSLGLAHARRYEEELASLSAVRNAVLREARRKDVAARHGAPALEWLRRARHAGPVERLYGEALLAALEKRWDAAVGKAREAFARSEGYYEARLLEARVLETRAVEELHAGAGDAARASLERAAAAAREAIRIGESDPGAYAAVCTAATVRLTLDLYSGGSVDEEGGAAVPACDAVLAIDPEHAGALRRLATVHRVAADALLRKGLDEGPSLEKAREAARRAVELEP